MTGSPMTLKDTTAGGVEAAEVDRIRDWLLERNREHLYASGVMIRRHAGDAEMFLDAAILLSNLAASPAPAPAAGVEGWKLVPIEPTLEMMATQTGYTVAGLRDEPLRQRDLKLKWADMLAAAPSPKAGETGNG